MTYEIGTKVFGDWEIIREIGHGAYGCVYEIRKTDFGVTARSAMKLIRIPSSDKEVKEALSEGMDEESVSKYFRGFVEDLVKEIDAMTRLSGHSNIVGYQDHHVIERTDGIGWDIMIRMEYLESLVNYLLREKTLAEEQVIKLGTDITKALMTCERYSIIHRDIKPDNIFVDTAGNFKLGDFGVARTIEKTTGGLSKKGTESYMAPEVYFGKPYGKTVDIYSLGLVLYRLTNRSRLPFYPLDSKMLNYMDRENALSRRMSGDKLPAPCDASREFSEVILKACAYDPKDRWQSAGEMKEALEKLRQNIKHPANGCYEDKEENIGMHLSSVEETEGMIFGQEEETMGSVPCQEENVERKVTSISRERKGKLDLREGDGKGNSRSSGKNKKRKKIYWVLMAFVVTAAAVCYWLFLKTYTVTVEGGSGSGKYRPNEAVTVIADEMEGYTFVEWQANGISPTYAELSLEELTFLMPHNKVTLTAVYEGIGAKDSFDEGVSLFLEEKYGEAYEFFMKAAELGSAEAMLGLGYMYQDGEGVEQDSKKALEWYEKAAEQGNASAMSNLGCMYQDGEGVEQDYKKALEWYEKAAEQGNASAMNNLGYMYNHGEGVEQDSKKALEWYEKAAEQGEATAMYNLGCMYQDGEGVEQDYKKALEWYEKAAEQGNASAMSNLGYMYHYGEGVEQDSKKAFEWYEKAAGQGEVVAMESLGFMYENGVGVELDSNKAEEWYEKAERARGTE